MSLTFLDAEVVLNNMTRAQRTQLFITQERGTLSRTCNMFYRLSVYNMPLAGIFTLEEIEFRACKILGKYL